MIVNLQGPLVGKQRDTNGSTFVAGVINIEALRHHRASAQVANWMKDVRSGTARRSSMRNRSIRRTGI